MKKIIIHISTISHPTDNLQCMFS